LLGACLVRGPRNGLRTSPGRGLSGTAADIRVIRGLSLLRGRPFRRERPFRPGGPRFLLRYYRRRHGRGRGLAVEVVVVAPEMGGEPAARDLDHLGRDAIDEVAVVGD